MGRISRRSVALIASTAMLMAFADPTLAEETATHQMAQIVMHLHHYPDDGDKKILRRIETNASPAEATIATALLHMEHGVRDKDKEKLDRVSKDTTMVPNNTRKLAEIVMNLMHKVSSSDKEILQRF